MNKKIRVTVWGENIHEWKHEVVRRHYPKGMHTCIAQGLNEAEDIEALTATLQEPEHGLTEERLANTDVLLWWGHCAHDQVDDAIVARIQARVWQGMGLLALHSAHFSKIFKALLGTACSLRWREAGELERVWVCNPGHPIARGLDAYFELPEEEMYGEPFGIPAPDELVFMSWFQGGEVMRSGATWKRGNGKIFYFRPGHESYPTYHNDNVKTVLKNAVRWLKPEGVWIDAAPHIPVEKAPEKIVLRGGSVH